ncbi:MAG: hypothetical protein O6941_05455 [Planctomycetota bacterium]|nr:hypothetical protein [Planctomycetota bacterium]
MFKFLRKYNKYILAVGGTLLMITFLIPVAFESLLPVAGQQRATWAQVGPDSREKVTVADLAQIQQELQVLQALPPLRGVGTIDQPEHWYLLVREAESAGLIGGTSSAAGIGQQIAQNASLTGQSPRLILDTLAKLDGVGRTIRLYQDATKFSDRRLKHHARRAFHRASVRLVVIEASAAGNPPQFSEAQLAQQMAKHAEDLPGEGEQGFGYRLGHRAKLQWLSIPADSVREVVENSDQLNPVALRKHWRLNPVQFGEPDSGGEVPDDVRRDLLDTLMKQTLDEIAKYASDQLRIKRRHLTRRGGYLELGDDWQDMDFEKLALDIQEKFLITLPQFHSDGDRWLEIDDLAQLPGIGRAATYKFGEIPVELDELVLAARELGGSQTMLIQQDVAGPPLRGDDESVYLFRIIDTDASRPPRSTDEVREALVADLTKLAHYQQLVGSGETLRQQAITGGLLSVAMAHNTLVRRADGVSLTDPQWLELQVQFQLPLSSRPTPLPTIEVHKPTVEAIIDHALALPQDVAIRNLPKEQRTLVIPVEDRLCVLVVQLTDQFPVTDEDYALSAGNGLVQELLLTEELDQGERTEDEFSFDALAARHNFVIATTQPATQPATQPDQGSAEQRQSGAGR